MGPTCLFIAPPARERIELDDVYELIVEPAFERSAWQLVWVARDDPEALPRAGEADAWIVDSRALDIDLAYRCGRRAGAGEPTVLLVAAASETPIEDAAAVLRYELSSARNAVEGRRALELHFDALADRAPQPDSAALQRMLEQLDRKVDRLLVTTQQRGGGDRGAFGGESRHSITESPRERLLAAVADERVEEVIALLPELRRLNPMSRETFVAAVIAASAADETGARALAENLNARWDELDPLERTSAVGALVRFGVRTDREQEVLDWFGEKLREVTGDTTMQPGDRAPLLNQLQMLYWGTQDLAEAERLARAALELEPDPAYKYNLALILEAGGRLDEAEQLVDQYLQDEAAEPHPDHLGKAVEIFLRRGREDEARALYYRLVELFPDKARVRRAVSEEIRQMLAEAEPAAG